MSGTPCECGDHFFAPIGTGLHVTMVSPEDAHLLDYNWSAARLPYGVIVTRRSGPRTNRVTHILAREIMKPTGKLRVDHINCNPTDNRRSNLRLATAAENAWNRRAERSARIPLKGVCLVKGKYQAAIQRHGKRVHLGQFQTAEAAHAAYAAAAKVLHGEFARVE